MKPGKLHLNARIRGSDGFSMCKFVYVCNQENFDNLMDSFKAQKINSPHICYDSRYISRKLIEFLKDFCSDGFCVAHTKIPPSEKDDYQIRNAFFIGFRNQKDLFKFSMKFRAKRILWWASGLSFTVVGTTDDKYVKAVAGEKWNKEDPHGFIEP